jgi:hypothetical protein
VRATRTTGKLHPKGEQFMESFAIAVEFFDLNEFIAVVLFSRLLTLQLPGLKDGRNPETGFLALPRIQIV